MKNCNKKKKIKGSRPVLAEGFKLVSTLQRSARRRLHEQEHKISGVVLEAPAKNRAES